MHDTVTSRAHTQAHVLTGEDMCSRDMRLGTQAATATAAHAPAQSSRERAAASGTHVEAVDGVLRQAVEVELHGLDLHRLRGPPAVLEDVADAVAVDRHPREGRRAAREAGPAHLHRGAASAAATVTARCRCRCSARAVLQRVVTGLRVASTVAKNPCYSVEEKLNAQPAAVHSLSSAV